MAKVDQIVSVEMAEFVKNAKYHAESKPAVAAVFAQLAQAEATYLLACAMMEIHGRMKRV